MTPQVSVVVPVRDGAGHVGRAIASALAQTGVDLEVVVVENGSVDDTADRVEEVVRVDPRARLVRMEPKGVSAARNAGISAAKGQWVAFLDADDCWRADKLSTQLTGSAGDLRFSDCWMVLGARGRVGRFHALSPTPAQMRGDASVLLEHLVAGPNCVPLSTTMVTRRRLEEAGGFDESLSHAEDYHLWLRLLLAGCSWARVPDQLVDYSVREHSASRDLLSMVHGERSALVDLHEQLVSAGLAKQVAHRRRALDRAALVHRRRAGSRLSERVGDLARLVRLGATPASVAAQAAYAVAPRATLRHVSGARHDVAKRLLTGDGSS